MKYPDPMADILKAVEAQKKANNFPDGLCGQVLKISVSAGLLAIEANAKKYGKRESTDLRKAAIDLIATTFIFLNELEKQP